MLWLSVFVLASMVTREMNISSSYLLSYTSSDREREGGGGQGIPEGFALLPDGDWKLEESRILCISKVKALNNFTVQGDRWSLWAVPVEMRLAPPKTRWEIKVGFWPRMELWPPLSMLPWGASGRSRCVTVSGAGTAHHGWGCSPKVLKPSLRLRNGELLAPPLASIGFNQI